MKNKKMVLSKNVETTTWNVVKEPSLEGSVEANQASQICPFPNEKLKFTCAICKKCFSDKNCLKKHILRIHEVEPGPLLQDNEVENRTAVSYRCRVCETEFAYKRNLKRHSMKYHSRGLEDEEGGNCFCNVEGCQFRSFFINSLRTHLTEEHKLQIDMENRVFHSKKDFDDWKENEEKTNVCLFIKEAGKHKLINGDQRLIYQCHRSGHYSGQGFGKRSFRIKGTCKLGKRCTAGIELTVKEKNDIHEVVYYKTHIWHQPDVKHVNLSASERAYLADKLREGTSIATILQSVKENKDEEGVNFCKRIQLLKRKDLVNIENTFRLNNTERHIKKQHKKGQKINHNQIIQNVDSYGKAISWIIQSTSNDSEYFTVEKLLSEKCVKHCGAVCSLCNACLHMYSCTCHEYLLFNTMCQHIHSVSLSLSPLQKQEKRTPKSCPDHIMDGGNCKEVNDNSPVVNVMLMYDKSLLNDTGPKEAEMIDYFNENFEQQQCVLKLKEGRVKLKQKLNSLSEICSTKIDHMKEDTVYLLTKIVDSALQVISPQGIPSESTLPINEPIPETMITTSPNELQHQQPMMASVSPNDFVLSTNVVTDQTLINELLTIKQENARTISNIAPQYYTTTERKKRKIEGETAATTFYKPELFDKQKFYERPSSSLNNGASSEDSSTIFNYHTISWQTSSLPVNSSSLTSKWLNTSS